MPCQGRKNQGDRIERAVIYHLRQKPFTVLGLVIICEPFKFSNHGVRQALNRLIARGVVSCEPRRSPKGEKGWPAVVYSLGVGRQDAAA